MMTTSTSVQIDVKAQVNHAPALAVLLPEGAKDAGAAGKLLAAEQRRAVERLLGSGVSRGKEREVHFDLLEKAGKYRRVFVAGLGDAGKITLETLRQVSAALARASAKQRVGELCVVLPAVRGIDPAAAAEAIVCGFLLASFNFRECKGTAGKDDEAGKGARLTLIAGDDLAAARSGAERGRIIADAQNLARTVGSRPGNSVNPPVLADIARKLAREVGLNCRVYDQNEMARLGLGGILAVGGGSATPPRLIVLEYKPKSGRQKNAPPLLVVGKAITFDAGGISIKPADRMGLMIYDKCGAMAVLGLMYAAAKLELPVPIVGVLSAAENTLDSKAFRPGDILRMYNGVTVEITSTDAEGRLVLGDALAWGIEKYRPRAVVDLATLTDSVVTALGRTIAGLLCNNDELAAELGKAARISGEKFWRLPMTDEHREQLKANHADIVNGAGREAGPSTAAAFIGHFVPRDGSVPWAHLDIAGVANTEKELPYYAKGPTGWGVRTLIEWVAMRAG